ncbi:MAG: DUF2807 domain-containing protein [Bacteroidales bacterium]|nr:DUF2807 domain-containing protein [Bacteroidales bacterium]
MKKIILSGVLVLMGLSLFAQSQVSVEHEYGAFDSITLTDYVNATIVPSDSYLVRITCDERLEDYIIAYVKEGVLDISIDTKAMPSEVKKAFRAGTGTGKLKEGETAIEVPQVEICLPKFRTLSVNGSSTVKSDSTLVSDKVSITLKKTASISALSLDTDSLYLEMSQKSQADITADVGAFNVQATNSVSLEMRLKKSEEVKVNAGSFANVEIYGEAEFLSITCDSNAHVKFETPSL